MNRRIAICDDNPQARDYLSRLVREWSQARGVGAALTAFPSGEAFLFAYAQDKGYDILLLDIEMGGVDGVTLARELRRDNETVQIIFVTGYSDYIDQGYEVAALHYLVKPVKEDKLWQVLDRAQERLGRNRRTLTLETQGEIVRIPLYQIRYADVQHNYVTIHAREDVTVKMPLSKLLPLLDEEFYQVGRSAVVNLGCIARVTKTDIYLEDGTVIPLPRGAYEGVNRAIINMR